MNVFALDTETTGLDPGSCTLLEISLFRPNPEHRMTSLVAQTEPIPTMAKAITLIDDEDVAGMPSRGYVMSRVMQHLDNYEDVALVAHNAEFDREFLPELAGYPWICTQRLARHLCPNAESHGLMYMRYYLGLKINPAGHPHRARFDAEVCWWVWDKLRDRLIDGKLCNVQDAASIVEFQERPVLLPRMNFGKHAGVDFDQIPKDYLRWMLKQERDNPGSWDRDLLFTINHWS